MTRSAGWAFTFAGINVVFSITSGLSVSSAIASATPEDAATISCGRLETIHPR